MLEVSPKLSKPTSVHSPQHFTALSPEALELSLAEYVPCVKLVEKAERLTEDLNRLEAEKDDLVCKLSALRELLIRIGREVEESRMRKESEISGLRQKTFDLKRALAGAEECALHLEEVSCYWQAIISSNS